MSNVMRKECRSFAGIAANWPTMGRDWERERWPTCRSGYDKDFDISFSEVLERALPGRPSVAIDWNVLGGTPHIGGTRIPVFMVLDAIEYYGTLDGALKSYPNLTIEQVKDAVNFASAVVEYPIDYEVENPNR